MAEPGFPITLRILRHGPTKGLLVYAKEVARDDTFRLECECKTVYQVHRKSADRMREHLGKRKRWPEPDRFICLCDAQMETDVSVEQADRERHRPTMRSRGFMDGF